MGYFFIPLLLWLLTVAVMDFKFRKVSNKIVIFGFLYLSFLVFYFEESYIYLNFIGFLFSFLFF